ncbi:NAD(P)-dependent oxidoreductase [Nocardia jiangsuensis]|uniref:NAD(P)-dependent oxidoreductase n=1 Tax=Nocardia jiangsuensis TaxID=1691563 RepID=A0ABV8DRJ2_9NOCA
MRIGFVGAGRMGSPMVARLAGAGHEVRALGRSAEARAGVAELGATPAGTVAEAAEGADAVVLCVFTDDQVREVCAAESFGDATLIVHTTGSPETVAAVAARGTHVVDAPVSGGPHDIARGSLTVFLGGADADVAVAREVLRAYADPILHVGPLGSGQRVKLVNNALFAAQIGLVADAVRLGAELGLPEDALLAALPHASGNSRALAGIAAKGSVAEFRSSVGEFLRKDVTVARALADALGADLGLLTAPIEAGVARP